VITGIVTADDEPTISLTVAGQVWPAVVDTGFNGDLELPERLRPHVNPRFKGTVVSALAGGQSVLEDVYIVDFPFDGQIAAADATFVVTDTILVGTHLLRRYRLTIDFVDRTILLERKP
jgi:predicted aspartyl protease